MSSKRRSKVAAPLKSRSLDDNTKKEARTSLGKSRGIGHNEKLDLRADPHEGSRLLALPPELRNHIYKEVFAGDETYCTCLNWHRHHHFCAVKRRLHVPALLQTCQQLRAEASDMWYSQLQIHFQSANRLTWLLRLMSSQQRSLVRMLVWDLTPSTSWLTAETYLDKLYADLEEDKVTVARDVLHARITVRTARRWHGRAIVTSDPRSDAQALMKADISLM